MIVEHTLIIINELTVVREDVTGKCVLRASLLLPSFCVVACAMKVREQPEVSLLKNYLLFFEIWFLTSLEFAKQARLCGTELQA